MHIMTDKGWLFPLVLLALAACGGDDGNIGPVIPASIQAVSGAGQVGRVSSMLPEPLVIQVTDAAGSPARGIAVAWAVVQGTGTVSPSSSSTDADGRATTQFTLGPEQGEQQVSATAAGLPGAPATFSATASTGLTVELGVAGGGNNVPERYSSDLWVHGLNAYTGTWGFRNEAGNVLKVWSLDAAGAPSLAGSVTVPGISTVSDVQVSDDGTLLALSGERGGDLGQDGGIYIYGLANPAAPTPVGSALVPFGGVHTVTLASLNGQLYAFAAKNPGFNGTDTDNQPALLIYSLANPATPTLVHREPIEPHYGIHDTFVRDGLVFVFAWDEGVIIYDVGNGIMGGSPGNPVKVSQVITAATSRSSTAAHNGWWFHNPVSGEKRYLFVGQEGPGLLGPQGQSSGDIHVVDVSDLTQPREVAFFHLNGAGTHNFWVDEGRQILYAAYYNAGVVALDISGTLSGDLGSRLLSQVRPGGAGNTFTWGVQLANGSLYAIDMLSGLWQLSTQ